MVEPFIVGSECAEGFLHLGVEILRNGGSAMDAVEAAVRGVEANPDELSVGLGGIPNLRGIIQLDASIMDGRSMKAGSVAAIEGFLHPVSVARRVLEVSPHALLVGEGAGLFADKMGFERQDLHTEYSREFYCAFEEGRLHELGEEYRMDLEWLGGDWKEYNIIEWYEKLAGRHHGTVDIMALDARGNISSGVSTSGTYLKFPGRVGDSPIIGAGNYCDNTVGAASCTGKGELAIRLSTARSIIAFMDAGKGVKDACVQAMRMVHDKTEGGFLSCLAFDLEGTVVSASTDEEPLYYRMGLGGEEEEFRGILVEG